MIKIGEEIEVTVLDIQRGQVRLGIKAPKDVMVLREELEKIPPKKTKDE